MKNYLTYFRTHQEHEGYECELFPNVFWCKEEGKVFFVPDAGSVSTPTTTFPPTDPPTPTPESDVPSSAYRIPNQYNNGVYDDNVLFDLEGRLYFYEGNLTVPISTAFSYYGTETLPILGTALVGGNSVSMPISTTTLYDYLVSIGWHETVDYSHPLQHFYWATGGTQIPTGTTPSPTGTTPGTTPGASDTTPGQTITPGDDDDYNATTDIYFSIAGSHYVFRGNIELTIQQVFDMLDVPLTTNYIENPDPTGSPFSISSTTFSTCAYAYGWTVSSTAEITLQWNTQEIPFTTTPIPGEVTTPNP